MQIGDEETAYFLSKMDDQINRLTYLVNSLLDVTKIRSGILDWKEDIYNLDEVIDETIEMLQKTSRRHRIVKKGDVKKYLKIDKNRLGQVLSNLIMNAIKYSPQASKVIVSVNTTHSDIIISVQDFGMGIPEEKQPHIFDRFVRIQTKRQHFPGMGLGLYISSELVKQFGGKIWVESEVNKGSTFSFTLPLRRQKNGKQN